MTKLSRRCPICDGEVTGDCFRMDDGTIEEEERYCLRCGFWYYFSYGSTDVRFDEQTWHFGWSESPNRKRVRAEIAQAIEDAKKQYIPEAAHDLAR